MRDFFETIDGDYYSYIVSPFSIFIFKFLKKINEYQSELKIY